MGGAVRLAVRDAFFADRERGGFPCSPVDMSPAFPYSFFENDIQFQLIRKQAIRRTQQRASRQSATRNSKPVAGDPGKGDRRKARLIRFEIFGVQGFVVGPALAPGIPSNPRGLFSSCVQGAFTPGLLRFAWFVPGPVTLHGRAGETAHLFADQVP